VFGSASGLDLGNTQSFHQTFGSSPEVNDYFGKVLAAGDFDGDGRDDLAVGVPDEDVGASAGAGYMNIFEGSAAGLVATSGFSGATLEGVASASAQVGAALAAGDIDGDGDDDLVIGSPFGLGAGRVFYVDGSATGLRPGSADLVDISDVGSPTIFDAVGRAHSLATGDVDGDDDADLGIGIPAQTTSGAFGAGAVAVLDLD